MLQLLRGVSFILVAFSGVEALTFVLDESHHPRRRLPRLLPTAITALALFFFFVTMTSTLAVDFTQLENGYLLPEMFRPLKAPAARQVYMCTWSKKLMSRFIPK
jgi:amino acid transporter